MFYRLIYDVSTSDPVLYTDDRGEASRGEARKEFNSITVTTDPRNSVSSRSIFL